MIETRRILLAGIQSARGTAATLTTTGNFLEASGIGYPKLLPIEVADHSFTPLDTPLPPSHVDGIWELGEDVIPMRLASALDSALPIGAMLQACGLTETLNAATNSVYKWSSQAPAARKLATINKYCDGELYSVQDVAGTAVIRGKVGEQAEFAFTGKGVANGTTPSTAAFPAAATASSTQGRLIISSATAVTQAGVAIPVSEFSIDFASDVQEFYDSDAGRGFEVVGWEPKLSITKLATVASSDWTALANATAIAFQVVLGSGRTMTIALPAAIPNAIDTNANNQRLFRKIDCSLHDSASDDAITITSI